MDFVKVLRYQWDRAAAVAAFLCGLLALGLGWLGISEAKLPTQQIPYLASAGLLGLFALGASCTLWLSADMRDEWRKLDLIHQELVDQRTQGRPPVAERADLRATTPVDVTDTDRLQLRPAQARS